jgi:hypothetical protein
MSSEPIKTASLSANAKSLQAPPRRGNHAANLKCRRNQFFDSAPGVFLVGSGVSGFKAPAFFLGSGTGTIRRGVCIIRRNRWLRIGTRSRGLYRVFRQCGVPAKNNVANVKAAVCFIWNSFVAAVQAQTSGGEWDSDWSARLFNYVVRKALDDAVAPGRGVARLLNLSLHL